MNKLTLNIVFGIVLWLMTIPATFLGRLFSELCLSLYYFVVGGRFPLYDAIFNTTLGLVIRNFFNESSRLYNVHTPCVPCGGVKNNGDTFSNDFSQGQCSLSYLSWTHLVHIWLTGRTNRVNFTRRNWYGATLSFCSPCGGTNTFNDLGIRG